MLGEGKRGPDLDICPGFPELRHCESLRSRPKYETMSVVVLEGGSCHAVTFDESPSTDAPSSVRSRV